MTRDIEPIERRDCDGTVTVTRLGRDLLAVAVVHEGEEQRLMMSEFNARRVFGMLSLMLELPLSPKVGKAIKL